MIRINLTSVLDNARLAPLRYWRILIIMMEEIITERKRSLDLPPPSVDISTQL